MSTAVCRDFLRICWAQMKRSQRWGMGLSGIRFLSCFAQCLGQLFCHWDFWMIDKPTQVQLSGRYLHLPLLFLLEKYILGAKTSGIVKSQGDHAADLLAASVALRGLEVPSASVGGDLPKGHLSVEWGEQRFETAAYVLRVPWQRAISEWRI